MSLKNKSIGLALLGALLALTSCRDLALDPVFYALSQEQPLGDDRGFPDAVTVHRMVKIGTRYFAAANTLYTRTDGPTDTWSAVAPPADAGLCNGVEVFLGDLYARFATGAGAGLYRSAPDPISWVKIDDLGSGSYAQVTMLRATSLGTPTLFVATWDVALAQFALSFSTSGDSGSYTVVSGGGWPATVSLSIVDVESDGNYYWVIVGNSLYRDDVAAGVQGSTFFSLLAPPDPDSGTVYFGGLLYDSSVPRLYLSAGNGYLHSSTDRGDTWTSSALQRDAEDNDVVVPFTAFVLPLSDGSPANTVYVGTQGQGYYRIPGGDVAGALTRQPSYNITDLYSGALNCLFFDSANAMLFLCTNGSGLWRGSDFSSTVTAWTWKQE